MKKSAIKRRLEKLRPLEQGGRVYFVGTQEEADKLSKQRMPTGSVIFIGDCDVPD